MWHDLRFKHRSHGLYRYAKTIISELLLEDAHKSVPRCDPIEFGGYAGGYICCRQF